MSKRIRWIFRQKPCEELPNVATVSVRLSWEDGLKELMDSFRSFLIASGFHPEHVDQAILEWADEIRETSGKV